MINWDSRHQRAKWNAYTPITELPNDIIILYEHSGGNGHPFVVTGIGDTDFYAAQHGFPVSGEDVPYPATGAASYVSKRHEGGFNIIRLDGAVKYFTWGTTTEADWHTMTANDDAPASGGGIVVEEEEIDSTPTN